MKILICSDVHLTGSFDEPKFAYLKSLFSSYDQIIMNGDFWDGYEVSFKKFIASKWQKLFPLMLEKKTIYLYGNHDKQRWTKSPELFSVEQYTNYRLTVGKEELFIEHGDRLVPSFDITWPKLSYILSSFVSSRRFQFGNKLRGFDNILMKKYALEHMNSNQILVCGHTHIPENNPKKHYMNTGFIDNGIASYVSIIGTSIKLITETYG